MSSESVLSIKNILADYLSLLDRPIPAPQIDAAPLGTAVPARDPSRQCALVLSPHPDDECLIGGLPLRLLQEENWQIINLAVTLGSKVARRGERNVELARSCAVLGFESFLPQADGFSEINIAGRETGALWDDQVARVAAIIAELQPDLIIHPHPADWNTTHVGTFLLAQDAMESLPLDFTCAVAYSEYWQPMAEPNLMLELGSDHVAQILSALACHAGEIVRNPYDRRLPPYLIDAVRRGSERLGGKGVAAQPMDFAMLYGLGSWRKGRFVASALNRYIGVNDPIATLFD